MRKTIIISAAIAISALSACKKAEETPATETVAVADETVPVESTAEVADISGWAGKWTGPEGLFVTITPAADDKITLEMQSDLDTKGTYEGTAVAEGISFKRGEETLTLKKATGDETGLKYLAGKKDCLMVKNGEGYCRD
jgi:hypothetical protein